MDRCSPNYTQALNAAKSEYFILSKKGTRLRRVHFTCAQCGNKFSRKQVAVDHKLPVIDPTTGYRNLDEYVARLCVPPEQRQVLCNNGKESCHKRKSSQENRIRRETAKEKSREHQGHQEASS